jgi:hypothetical protein
MRIVFEFQCAMVGDSRIKNMYELENWSMRQSIALTVWYASLINELCIFLQVLLLDL